MAASRTSDKTNETAAETTVDEIIKRRTSEQKSTGFVSRADSSEMREYQNFSARHPPLEHEEIIRLSRKFIRGRNQQVSLDEHDLVDSVINGDWSDESILSHSGDIIAAYKKQIDWLGTKKTADSIVSPAFKGKTVDKIWKERNENVLSDMPWLPPISLASAYPAVAACPQDQFDSIIRSAISAIRDKISEMRPADTPKDIVDRWSERLEIIKDHCLTAVKELDRDPVQLRRARREISRGEEALDTIVSHNLQLAMSRVGKFMQSNQRAKEIGASDLIGAANIGLILGARQFDPEMGRRFSTYASYHIDGQLYEILSREDGKSGIQGMTPHETKQLNMIMSTKTAFERIYHRSPTMAELQSLTGIARIIIKKRLDTPQLTTQSINAPVKGADDESMMLSDLVASEKTVESEMDKIRSQQLMDVLREQIAGLPRIYRIVLCGKTGIDPDGDGRTEQVSKPSKVIAKEAGIHPRDVSNKYNDALVLLRQRLLDAGWTDDTLAIIDNAH